jgi:putative transposase
MGLILVVMVHTANIQDRDGAKLVIEGINRSLWRLKVLFADGGYAGQLIAWVKDQVGWTLDIVKRSDSKPGFHVLPKRWIVERTFGWLGLYRRHSKDYEELPENSEAMIYISMIRLMTRRLAKKQAIA